MPNGGQSKLEILAIEARKKLIPKNIYNSEAPANGYNKTHTRALADTQTPAYGKGTGNYLDINNYAAGSDTDINGTPSYPGTGRKSALELNVGTWGFGPNPADNYKEPDTSKNIGQVII